MITKEELLEQANTIKIALGSHECDVLLEQINNILKYVSNIDNYNYEDAEELQFMVDDTNRLRKDIPTESISLQASLKNAPKKNDNFFKVPRVIE